MSHSPNPLVSICMPAYNVASVVGEALKSVLAQSYPHIEVIVVDDGSSDGTFDVIRSSADGRVRLFRNEKNRGGYQTMNQAMALARGDFIAIYHSDDVYEPIIVENEVSYLQAHPDAGAVFCLDYYIDDDGKVFGGMSLPKEFRGHESLNYMNVFPFLLRHKNTLLRCPTFMTRRDILVTVGPFNAERYDIAADLDMWIRIVRQFPVGILDERLLYYRVSKKQWSSRYKRLRTSQELYFDILDYYLEADGWFDKVSAQDLIEYAFHRCDDMITRAANLIISNDASAAVKLLQHPFPWRTFLHCVRRRKVRVLLLRTILRLGLALGAVRLLGRVLIWTEYKGRL